MSYTVTTSTGTIVIQDGTTDTTSLDLTLIGKNYSGYGEVLNQNYVKLLENFAGSSEPSHPIQGQVWYNTTDKIPRVYTGVSGGWKNIGSATAASSAPANANQGDLWYNTTTKQLSAYNIGASSTSWDLIGPAYTAAQLKSGQFVTAILETGGPTHLVVEIWIGGQRIGIISKDAAFIPDPLDANYPGTGFATITPGLNFSTDISNVKVSDSDKLDGLDSTQFMRTDANTSTTGNLTISNPTVSESKTTGALKVTGGVGIQGNLFAGNVSATGLAGTLSTVAQPNVTSVGILSSLSVTGNIAAGNVTATTKVTTANVSTATLYASSQSQLQSIIATSLDSGSGTIQTTGEVKGSTVTAATLVGTLNTAAQTNITSVGTLTGLSISGPIVSSLGNLTLSTSGGSQVVATVPLSITNASVSTSTTTGALVVGGGAGFGGNIFASGTGSFAASTVSTSISTGALVVGGGAGFGGNVYIGNNTSIAGSAASSSTTTGALVVSGGVGVAGAINAGGAVKTAALWTDNYYYANGSPLATGSGTVSSGTVTRLAYYASNGAGVSDNSSLTWTAGSATFAVTGNLSVRNITTTSDNTYEIGASGASYANVWATTFRGTTTRSQYADLAEVYETDEQYEIGTVIAVGGEREATACTTQGDVAIIGVVSEKPGLLMNENAAGQAIALRGKVPVLVTGAIARGDLIISSAQRGCGKSVGKDASMKSVAFAIALESNSSSDIKSVMALIL